ncbi:MAG: universal stress protein [Vicinamibacteria bacterium]
MLTTAKSRELEPASAFGYRDILVPTDLSLISIGAGGDAACLARRFGGRLTLFHALEFPDHDAPHWAFGDRRAVWAERERSAREQLAATMAGLGVPCEAVVEHAGSAAVALVDRIAARPPDLVVMTTHGRGGLAHLLLGSVAEEVVRKGGAPVLCVKGDMGVGRALSGCVAVATDLSDDADPALHAAGALAEAFGGELMVVATPSTEPDFPWQPYSLAEQRLATLAHRIPVRLLVDTAPPRTAVARVVKKEHAGLVVTARGRAGDRAAGAAAAAMVRNSPCSVLVV